MRSGYTLRKSKPTGGQVVAAFLGLMAFVGGMFAFTTWVVMLVVGALFATYPGLVQYIPSFWQTAGWLFLLGIIGLRLGFKNKVQAVTNNGG